MVLLSLYTRESIVISMESPRRSPHFLSIVDCLHLQMIIIQRRLMLNRLPHIINPLQRLLTQTPSLNILERLLNLLETTRAKDNRVAMLLVQWRIVRHPPICQLRRWDALLLRDLLPLLQRFEVRGPIVQLRVQATQRIFSKPANAFFDLLLRFGQETAGDGRVGVECYIEFAQGGEEKVFLFSGDSVIVAWMDTYQ